MENRELKDWIISNETVDRAKWVIVDYIEDRS